jgi:predicted lipoprotein
MCVLFMPTLFFVMTSSRQELTDAAKQKRLPDPGIVPVVPRAPSKQGDRVAVRVKKTDEAAEDDAAAAVADMDSEDEGEEMLVETGPKSGGSEEDDGRGLVAGDTSGVDIEMQNGDNMSSNIEKVVGGAWG